MITEEYIRIGTPFRQRPRYYALLFWINLREDHLSLWWAIRNVASHVWQDNFEWQSAGGTGCVCDWRSSPGFRWLKDREVEGHINACPKAIEHRRKHR